MMKSLRVELKDENRAYCSKKDLEVCTKSPILSMCRKLVANIPDIKEYTMEVYRDSTKVMVIEDIVYWSGKSITETDKKGITLQDYNTFKV